MVTRTLLHTCLRLQDFANMPIDEVRANINSRRDRIFLLMEELRRLRIQQRLKVGCLVPRSLTQVT